MIIKNVTRGRRMYDAPQCKVLIAGQSYMKCMELKRMLNWAEEGFRVILEQNICSCETLLERVWGFDSNAVENHVEVYVGFLRKKLNSIGSNLKIEAIRRLGYHLEVADVC